MRAYFCRMWSDDRAALLSAEWVFMGTVLVIGITVGLVCVRDAVDSEMAEFSNAVTHLDQSYRIAGIGNHETLNGSYSFYAAGSGAENFSPGNAGTNNLRLYAPLHGTPPVDEHLTD